MSTNKLILRIIFVVTLLGLGACKNEVMMKDEVIEEAVKLAEVDLSNLETNDVVVHANATTEIAEESLENPYNLKVIKSANARYRVKDIRKASSKIKELAIGNNGYVSEMRFTNNTYKKENVFTIKVANYQFEELLQNLASIAEEVAYENITTQDVTEAYIDAESRLKVKQKVKARYEEILRKKAHKVEDLLEVEEKINDIQEEIEAVQGKLNYMKNKVTLSSIQVELYEELEEKLPVEEDSFGKELKEGMHYGINIIQSLLLALVYIWPIILVGIIVVFWLKKRRKK